MPLVVGALGGLTGVSLSHFVLALAGTLRIERAQQCAILGSHSWTSSSRFLAFGIRLLMLRVELVCINLQYCICFDIHECAVWRFSHLIFLLPFEYVRHSSLPLFLQVYSCTGSPFLWLLTFCIRICPVLLHLFVFEYVASSIVLLISVRLSVSIVGFQYFCFGFYNPFCFGLHCCWIIYLFFSLITLGLFWPGDGVLTSCHDNVSEIKPTP